MKKLMNIIYDISEKNGFHSEFSEFLMGLLSILLNMEKAKMHKSLREWVLLCFFENLA